VSSYWSKAAQDQERKGVFIQYVSSGLQIAEHLSIELWSLEKAFSPSSGRLPSSCQKGTSGSFQGSGSTPFEQWTRIAGKAMMSAAGTLVAKSRQTSRQSEKHALGSWPGSGDSLIQQDLVNLRAAGERVYTDCSYVQFGVNDCGHLGGRWASILVNSISFGLVEELLY
jgi:hypothetical protein